MVSHPLRMREALGPKPSVSIAYRVRMELLVPGKAHRRCIDISHISYADVRFSRDTSHAYPLSVPAHVWTNYTYADKYYTGVHFHPVTLRKNNNKRVVDSLDPLDCSSLPVARTVLMCVWSLALCAYGCDASDVPGT